MEPRQAGLALLEEYGNHPDFGDIQLAASGVVMRWRGPQPDQLQTSVEQLNSEHPSLVQVLPAAYGAAELQGEGWRIIRRFSTVFPYVVRTGASPDGNAIDLAVLPGMLQKVHEGGVPLEVLLETPYPLRAVEDERPIPD